MKNVLNYKLFLEIRLSDVSIIKGTGLTYQDNVNFDDEFLKYKTISKRINNEKIRINLYWNDTLQHDLKKRIKERTSLKNIAELNYIISNGLDELYIYYLQYFNDNGVYALWFSEYDFSLIVDKNNNDLIIKTILHGKITNRVKNVIEIKTKL